jgi:hypothetical protein
MLKQLFKPRYSKWVLLSIYESFGMDTKVLLGKKHLKTGKLKFKRINLGFLTFPERNELMNSVDTKKQMDLLLSNSYDCENEKLQKLIDDLPKVHNKHFWDKVLGVPNLEEVKNKLDEKNFIKDFFPVKNPSKLSKQIHENIVNNTLDEILNETSLDKSTPPPKRYS